MTETIFARRVWTGETRRGDARFDLIGVRDGRTFHGSTLNAWIASVWERAATTKAALRVTWTVTGDGRYHDVTGVEPLTEGVSA